MRQVSLNKSMLLEIFGPFQESSLPGLWRGLVATAVVLAASAVLRPSDLGCLRIFLLAVASASAVSVLRTGTAPGSAAVYGSLVGLVVGAFAAAREPWSEFFGTATGGAAVGAAAAAVAYWSEGLLK
jgi:hypothetical protein